MTQLQQDYYSLCEIANDDLVLVAILLRRRDNVLGYVSRIINDIENLWIERYEKAIYQVMDTDMIDLKAEIYNIVTFDRSYKLERMHIDREDTLNDLFV